MFDPHAILSPGQNIFGRNQILATSRWQNQCFLEDMNLEQICAHGFRYQSSSISFFANPNTSQFGSLELLQHSLDLTEGQSKAQFESYSNTCSIFWKLLSEWGSISWRVFWTCMKRQGKKDNSF
jgi:hypothetical protein